jgi:hypothetical protein
MRREEKRGEEEVRREAKTEEQGSSTREKAVEKKE